MQYWVPSQTEIEETFSYSALRFHWLFCKIGHYTCDLSHLWIERCIEAASVKTIFQSGRNSIHLGVGMMAGYHIEMCFSMHQLEFHMICGTDSFQVFPIFENNLHPKKQIIWVIVIECKMFNTALANPISLTMSLWNTSMAVFADGLISNHICASEGYPTFFPTSLPPNPSL